MSDQPRRRAVLRKQRESFAARMLAFSLIAAVVGSGLAAYSTSRLMLNERNNMTVYVPESLLIDSPGSALVMLTDAQGMPLARQSVGVEVQKEGVVVWSETATTDDFGIASPSFRGLSNVGPATVTVKGGGETVSRVVKIETTTRIFLQTDKPIYQPGQVVHIRTLTFSGTSPRVSMENVTLEVSAPSGDRIFRKTLVPDDYGIAAYDYSLGTRLPFGLYKIKGTVGQENVEKAFGVQRYVLPRFVIQFQGMKGWYGFNESVSGSVCVDYVFGEHVQGSVILSSRVYTGTWSDVHVYTYTMYNGCAGFALPQVSVQAGATSGYIELKATAIDTAGHSETKTKNVPISGVPILITALADTNVPGAISDYYIIARWPDGTAVANADVTYLYNVAKTDSRGVAHMSFTYNGQSSLSVTVSKGSYSSTLYTGLRSEPGVKVVASKTHYEIGETANLQVYFYGSSLTNWVYYEVVARNFVMSTGRQTLSGTAGQFSINVDKSLVPMAEVRVYKVLSDLTVSRDNVVFTIGTMSDLSVDITADRQEYRPGDDVTLDFYVREDAQPTAAALGVSIVDTAVYEVDERFKGLEDALKGEEGSVSYDSQVIDYVYGESSIPPDAGAPLVVTPQTAFEGNMQSSLPARQQQAKDAQGAVVSGYWFALLLIGLAGVLGLVVLGVRNRKYAVVAVAVTLIVPAVLALGYFAQRNYGPISWDLDQGQLMGGGTTTGTGMNNGVPSTALLPGGFVQWWQTRDTLGGSDENLPSPTSMVATPARVRSFFPETWYWNPSLIVGPDGRGNISIPAPDSITTWAVDAIASTKDAEFGSGNTTVRVFQDFFVEPDIPVAAVQNDTFDMSVSVFNYLDAINDVSVQLQADSWFVLTGPSQKFLTLPANSVGSTYFTITATELGGHNVTIVAGNSLISDAVRRVMYVDPRGTPVEETFSGRLSNNEAKSVFLVLRPDRIPSSESAIVRIQPSMTAAVLDGAENYINYVSGCGEQSMSTLNIDVLAFRLVSEGTSDQKMLESEQIVSQGIQHELQFLIPAKNGQGRGIVWFPGDQDVHPWLTSWGLITFKDAIDGGFGLDEKILSDMQSWLVSTQESDGSWRFPEWGIYEFNNPILKSKQIATTAYIARALIYSGYAGDSSPVQRALDYVQSRVHDSWDDPYVLALSLIVLADANGPSGIRAEIASRLVELKKEDNGTVYWKSPSSLLSDGDYRGGGYWGQYDSRTSETTGYAVMALFKQDGITSEVSGGVEYLLKNRNSFGGFFSTQDTVVSLQALLTIGSGSATESLDVTVETNGVQVGSTHFDQSSKDVTYLLDVSSHLATATTVNISGSGKGSVVYQVALKQFVPWEAVVPPPCELCFELLFNGTRIFLGQSVAVDVNVTYNGESPQLKMVLVTIKSGVGLTFDAATLDSLVSSGVVSLYELNVNSATLYIQNVVKGTPVKFTIAMIGHTPFQGTIEGSNAQDLYDPGLVSKAQPLMMTVIR